MGYSFNSAERPSAQPDRLVFQKRTVVETLKTISEIFINFKFLTGLLRTKRRASVKSRYSLIVAQVKPLFGLLLDAPAKNQTKTYWMSTKVASVLDFVTYFGGAPGVDITSIELDALKPVSSST